MSDDKPTPRDFIPFTIDDKRILEMYPRKYEADHEIPTDLTFPPPRPGHLRLVIDPKGEGRETPYQRSQRRQANILREEKRIATMERSAAICGWIELAGFGMMIAGGIGLIVAGIWQWLILAGLLPQ